MPVPQKPPLNGRNLAEFYLSTETAKRTTLRAYARPPQDQEARIIMYDPIRRIVPEYFANNREAVTLTRCAETLALKRFRTEDFTERYHKTNRSALAHLRDFDIRGMFEMVSPARASITVGKLTVISTVDFYARYVPSASNSKPRQVGVIVNPAGIRKVKEDQRKMWALIEAEVAFRAAASKGIKIEGIMYLDLGRGDLHRFKQPRQRIWAEIDATCDRIFRDWREIRLEMQTGGEETG
jgi:hypothetical protein